MIVEAQGDLLSSDCNVICHIANSHHTMGKGIAKQLRDKWPQIYEADKKTPYGSREKMGTYSTCNVGENKVVINLYAQFYYGRRQPFVTGSTHHLEYRALKESLERLKSQLIKQGVLDKVKIGIPYHMGCRNAGGDWTKVREIIESVLADANVVIYKP